MMFIQCRFLLFLAALPLQHAFQSVKFGSLQLPTNVKSEQYVESTLDTDSGDRLVKLETKQDELSTKLVTLTEQMNKALEVIEQNNATKAKLDYIAGQVKQLEEEQTELASTAASFKTMKAEMKEMRDKLNELETKDQDEIEYSNVSDDFSDSDGDSDDVNEENTDRTDADTDMTNADTDRTDTDTDRTDTDTDRTDTDTDRTDSDTDRTDADADRTEITKASVNQGCPEAQGYVKLSKTMCFRQSAPSDEKTWEDGEDACQREGAQLLTFYNQAEHNLVLNYLKAQGTKAFDKDFHRLRSWLGLKRSKDGEWAWTTDSKMSPSWGEGCPLDMNSFKCGGLEEDGVTDGVCILRRRYLCRIK